MLSLFLFALPTIIAKVADAKVCFEFSEVFDTVDLKGVNKVDLNCFSGCKVYSPTKNSQIVIVNSKKTIMKSLRELSELIYPNYYELPPGDLYTLENRGGADPGFVLYAVERGAANYMSGVIYLDAGTNTRVEVGATSMVTLLSSSGVIQVYDWAGDYSDGLPTVHATGFDSVYDKSCRPVYQARNPWTIPKTVVPILSPIATIDFKSGKGGKSARISGVLDVSPGKADSSMVFVSPGYVGCNIKGVKDALYSQVPAYSIESSATFATNGGFSVNVNGDYSIASEEDSLNITANYFVDRLYGTEKIHISYTVAGVVELDVSWRNPQNSDRFGLQIDVETLSPGTFTESPLITKSTGAEPTTSKATRPFKILALSFAILFGAFF